MAEPFKADIAAADRVLKAAVRGAVRVLKDAVEHDRFCGGSCAQMAVSRIDAAETLAHATHAASLLLDGVR